MKTKGAVGLSVEEVERAKALAGLGRSYRQIAAELHRSDHAVKRALTKSPEVVAQVQAIKADLASSFEGLAQRMIGSITDADIAKLDGYKKTLSGAIAADKAQLLKGEPTSIVGIEVLLDVAGMIRRRRDEEDEAHLEKWEQSHALPVSPMVERLPAPSAAPVLTSTKKPPVEPTPQFKVRYYAPTPLPDDNADDSNPLMRGLRTP